MSLSGEMKHDKSFNLILFTDGCARQPDRGKEFSKKYILFCFSFN
jgi:hypothetical protein